MSADRQVINLCFHGVGKPQRDLEPGEDQYWVSEGTFLSILDEVVGRPDVRLSFDDGNASDAEFALPALLERRLVADFFPIAARLDTAGSLGREQIRSLASSGMTIGSHGMHHQPWRGLRGRDLDEEFDTARAILAEAAGADISRVACPMGSYGRHVLRELKARGYSWVGTSDRLPAHRDSWLQPRFSVRGQDDAESIVAIMIQVLSPRDRLTSAIRTFVKRWR